ncbi:PLDc N-terminal domain-containing protein [Belliella marina]|uniref:PLDc N-terminal domain-containing protein n=1 Tax=Belliella marina TaxID=1644146 RepID=A0ABW4VJN0_9BACT
MQIMYMEFITPNYSTSMIPNAVFLAMVLYGILWIWCIVDLLNSEFKDNSVKLLWGLILIFINPLAPFLYSHISRKQKIRLR